ALADPDSDLPLLAVAENGAPAVVRSDWQIGAPPAAPPSTRSLLFADRARYEPGERVQVRGLARRRDTTGALVMPATDTPCRLQLHAGELALGPLASCGVEASTGAISGSLPLAPRLPPGDYSLVAQIGDESLALPIFVAASAPAGFTLTAAPAGTRDLLLQVSRDGLPLAGAVVSWSLRLAPMAAPTPPEGFTLDALPLAETHTFSGQASADTNGRIHIVIPESPDDQLARSYSLRASLLDHGPGVATAQGTLSAGPTSVAIALPSRLVASNRRSALDLLALDSAGHPAPGSQVKLEVFRAGAPGAPVLARRAVAGSDGLARIELVQLRPGEYELVATADGPSSRARLWVYGPGFAGWRAADGQLELVADRDRYSPGEIASLLVVAPETTGGLLLTVERGGLLGAELRSLRAGQVITLPITADMAPGVHVGAILTAGGQRRAGAVALAVTSPPSPLAVSVEAGQAETPPNATVPITITTLSGGAPQPADLLVTIAPEQAPDAAQAQARFTPGPPAASTVADLVPESAALPPGAPPAPRGTAAPPGHLASIETAAGAPRHTTSQIRLPAEAGRWRITAFAASGPDWVAASSTVITTRLPLEYTLVAPAALRDDDRASLSLLVRNTSSGTRAITVSVTATGLSLSPPAPATQRLSLGPGSSAGLRWEARP
ncbi:MAG: hypothetical protein HGA45_43150, partial [Chloroflexales bacterium]|nr:hypothetical protein [Chloroflexales bacterium]